MKKSQIILSAITVVILSAFTVVSNTTWELKEDYSIKFISDNPEGIFRNLDGKVQFNPSDLAGSSFDMKVEVNSINTGRGMQNKHAVSDKWFDAEKYPYITFKSTKISEQNGGYAVTGDLQIKDVTKEITFPFTFAQNTFKGTFEIDRMQYNIGTMNGMDKKASQMLKVELSVPVSKK